MWSTNAMSSVLKEVEGRSGKSLWFACEDSSKMSDGKVDVVSRQGPETVNVGIAVP